MLTIPQNFAGINRWLLTLFACYGTQAWATEITLPPQAIGQQQYTQLADNGRRLLEGHAGIWQQKTQSTQPVKLLFPKASAQPVFELTRLSPKADKVLGYRQAADAPRVPFIADLASGEARDLPALDPHSEAKPIDIDAAGQSIIGISQRANGHPRNTPLVWQRDKDTETWAVQALPVPARGQAKPSRIAHNGQSIVGSIFEHERAALWTRATQRWALIDLSRLLPSITVRSSAESVSADGQIVAGWYRSIYAERHAFVWSQQTGMHDLLSGHPGWKNATAAAVSSDGRVIVGTATERANGKRQAVRWVRQNDHWQMQTAAQWIKQPLKGKRYRAALDVSDDGNSMLVYGDDMQTRIWLHSPRTEN